MKKAKRLIQQTRNNATMQTKTAIEFFVRTCADTDGPGANVAVVFDTDDSRCGGFYVESVGELNEILRDWGMTGEDLESYEDKRTESFYTCDKTKVDAVLKAYKP